MFYVYKAKIWMGVVTSLHGYYYYFLKAHQHKAAGRKTRLDIQNYGCNGNLLCYHGVVERNRISSLQSHGKALEKECCLMIIIILTPVLNSRGMKKLRYAILKSTKIKPE